MNEDAVASSSEESARREWVQLSSLDVPRFAAAAAGLHLLLSAVGHPLSVLKTRAQHGGVPRARGLAALSGLYVAFWPATLGALPAEAAYLFALEGAREALDKPASEVLGSRTAGGAVASFAAGFAANFASAALYTPIEVTSSRAFVAPEIVAPPPPHSRSPVLSGVLPLGGDPGVPRRGFAAAAARIAAESGPRGFYRGFAASLATAAPCCAVWWCVYALARDALAGVADSRAHQLQHAPSDTQHSDSRTIQLPLVAHRAGDVSAQHLAIDGAAGLVAGCVAAVATQPLDTIRTRMQTGASRAGWAAAAMESCRVPGSGVRLRLLWAGLGARLTEMGPLSAIGAVGYEAAKRMCIKQEHEQRHAEH